MRQRGFALFGLSSLASWALTVVAGVAAVLVFLEWHAAVHFQLGVMETRLEWAEENRKAQEEAELERMAVETAIGEIQVERDKAARRADEADTRWKEARRASRRDETPLSVCAGPAAADGPVRSDRGVDRAATDDAAWTQAHPAGADRGPALTWRFVHEYDTAWTSLEGEPLPGAAEGRAGAAGAATASPYGHHEVLDVHGENARRCSEDRRNYAALIAKIEAAAEVVDRGVRP